MTDPMRRCDCGHSFLSGGEERASNKCPECGRSFPRPSPQEDSAMKGLSDSLIEATYEVLAEEGAIWSGAR
ncbi:MAG: hypothetical protein MUO52_08520 [Desulfobacterales bacterium]|nr:hypothetical protein [Desulfobacterales bacterium]